MPDQAHSLRQAAGLPGSLPLLPAIAVTGGKGGVGKTCVSVNLAVSLAKIGLRPLLVDLDLGLANADVLLGVNPERSLAEVITQGVPLAQVVVPTAYGVDLVPAASGRDDLTSLSEDQHLRLFHNLGQLTGGHDLIILDTAAGVHRTVTSALRSSQVVLLVVTPDPTSITDAYALLKVLEGQERGKDIRVLVNQAANLAEAQAVCQRLRGVAQKFLGRDLTFIGHLPRERAVTDAIRARKPFAHAAPTSQAAQALRQLAMRIKSEAWIVRPG
jgi:flagellar biosynthesis protein FlhG